MGLSSVLSLGAIVVCLFVTLHTCSAIDCKMADFPVKNNLQSEKFAGKWYEIKWIIEPWIPPEWNFLDYFQVFTLKGSDFDIFWLGRIKSGNPYCVPGSGALYSVGENAKFLYDRKYNGTTRMNSTYWIIDTDYDNYALAYGCRELATDGTCVQPDCWLWSRRPTLEANYIKTMEDQLPGLCITLDMLLVTKQEEECTQKPRDNFNPASKGVLSRADLSLLLIGFIAVIRSCL